MNSNSDKIAVIGMACRFPGAKNLNEYWNNLLEGKDTIKHFSDEELSKFEINYLELQSNPNYVKVRGVIEDIEKFDAEFFGMTSKEAAETDPQHRVWLETAWEAFENAGCDPINNTGAIGVFAGSYINTYLLNNILRDPVKLENYIRLRTIESYQIQIRNDDAYIPTKTAYQFNLKGPAIDVQTACSTSLVAISQACQSLFSFESDICLAGGVCIAVPQESGYIYQDGAIPSPDGCCRPFDIKGQGTVFSNGVGAVVLKRLEDALADRDRIYALVSGWALNNDGNNKVSYLAPSVDGQAEVIMMAQSFAGVTPEQIGYVEAHGTATQLGDPIEITALKKAFSRKTDQKQFCGVGSVKSNIGHTDAAAGVASFIKTCLAACHRKIPPTIHYSVPNKYIKFEKTPFYVLNELKEWTEERPLIMGVSSFGIGGTNAHVIIEEPPQRNKSSEEHSELPELIVLSAKSEESLKKRKQDLIDYITLNPGLNIKDISFTLASGRNHMPYRSYTVASETSDINALTRFIDGKKDDLISKIAFMFPGQGTQYVSMGQDLYKTNRLFRQILDECFEIIRSEMGEDIKSLIFDVTNNQERESKLARTEFTQPALFSVGYALSKVLEQLNVKPDFLIGHGVGEITAACVAGVFDMKSALKIVIKKGYLNATHASYSGSFDPVLKEFQEYVDQFNMKAPGIPFISCLTGKFIAPEEAVSGTYWAEQLRNTVQINNGVSLINENEDVLFLEVGPNSYLSSVVKENNLVKNQKAIISTLGMLNNVNESYKLIAALGSIYNIGLEPDYPKQKGNELSMKISLPTYPFKRDRHWIDFEYPKAIDSVD
ncbi:MAG: type I polyketide synthase [Bacteroidales bacterium]